MTINDFLPFSLSFLHGTGLFAGSQPWRKFLSLGIFLPATLILNILIAINFGRTHGEILLTAEAIESLSTYSQLTVRKFIFLIHGPLIEEIIQDCQHEWQYNLFGPLLEAELRNKMKFCVKMTKCLVFSGLGTISLMGVTALMDPSKSVPLKVWIPDMKWAVEITFFSEMVILFETLYYVIASDSFYLLMGANLQVQLRLMGETVKSIRFGLDDDAKCVEKLRKCVQHHRWILRLHHKLNKVFSEYFIVQYVITVTTVAIQIYLAVYSNVSLDMKIKSVVYIFSVMLQVALYFIPASNIETEAEKFAQDLYLATWERNRNVERTKLLTFMMMKSQKPLTTVGAGMLHVTRPMYLGIFRTSFTIATILGNSK